MSVKSLVRLPDVEPEVLERVRATLNNHVPTKTELLALLWRIADEPQQQPVIALKCIEMLLAHLGPNGAKLITSWGQAEEPTKPEPKGWK